MSKNPLKVVIDASVARASGSKEEVPSSTLSRQFLEKFRMTNNKMVMTHEIYREWNKHESLFAKTWRTHMIASKRMEVIKDYQEHIQIREAVEVFIKSDKVKREVLKDIHLVEAAVVTDNYIISNDNKVRSYLSGLACNYSNIKEIVWVNPTNPDEEGVNWLENGCARDDFRKIGFLAYDEVAPS